MTTEQRERQNMAVVLALMLGASGLAFLTLNLYPQVDWFFVLVAFLFVVALAAAGLIIAAMIYSWRNRGNTKAS